ncbi:MAG: hypothetical protein HC835_14380 [Oscillatoriales cyanobacterium RM2_1_1]|nr:hypothetical protein [Oscillatoriales cyanobacterium SM2_3_0]NJO46707.1 hypothetical protein [Oscillatoriales cyanobacterium RM2_1_1]
MIDQFPVLSPVYVVVLISTVFSVLCGLIFKDMLEYWVGRWSDNPDSKLVYKTPDLVLAYGLMTAFVTFCIASGLLVFIPIYWFAGTLGALVVIPTALLIWVQLGSMLKLLETKGLEAVDLDLVIESPVQDTPPQSLAEEG